MWVAAHVTLLKRLDRIEAALKESGQIDATILERVNTHERSINDFKVTIGGIGRKVENMVMRLYRLEMRKSA